MTGTSQKQRTYTVFGTFAGSTRAVWTKRKMRPDFGDARRRRRWFR